MRDVRRPDIVTKPGVKNPESSDFPGAQVARGNSRRIKASVREALMYFLQLKASTHEQWITLSDGRRVNIGSREGRDIARTAFRRGQVVAMTSRPKPTGRRVELIGGRNPYLIGGRSRGHLEGRPDLFGPWAGHPMAGKEGTVMGQKDRVEKAEHMAELGPKRGGKHTVEMGGKIRGRHRTRAEAVEQVQAINLSKLRAEGRRDVPPEPKKDAGGVIEKGAPQMDIWDGVQTR